jgi:hypothetical protein
MKSVFDRAQKRFTTSQFVIALGALFLGIVGISYAVSALHIFTSGTVISSSEVNANFDTLKAAVDALEAKVGSNIPSPSRLGKMGYAFANDGGALTPYTPNSTDSFNSSGGAITATRLGIGDYTMTFSGLGSNTNFSCLVIRGELAPMIIRPQISGIVQVTASPPAAYCRTTSWDATCADASIRVACFNSGGAAVDSPYNVLFVM